MRRNAPKAHPEQVPAVGKSRKRRAAGNRLRRKTAPGEGHRNRGLGKGKGMKARMKAGAPPHGRERFPPPPGREGPGAAPRPQSLTGPLQAGMKVLMRAEEAGMCEQAPPEGDEGCRMRDAGDQPKTFMSSAPTLPATVAIAASAEIPPARLFSACSRELMRISCMASRLP